MVRRVRVSVSNTFYRLVGTRNIKHANILFPGGFTTGGGGGGGGVGGCTGGGVTGTGSCGTTGVSDVAGEVSPLPSAGETVPPM